MTRILSVIFASVVTLLTALPAYSCSIHSHGCRYHGEGLVTPGGVDSGTNGLTAVLGWDNGVDLDIHGLLPGGQGPYVNASGDTSFDHVSEPYTSPGEHPRHLYYSQHTIEFANGTAQAIVSGDVAGTSGSNPNGECSVEGSVSCESIVITGNVPEGTYRFTAHNFADDAPDPSARFSLRVYGTGQVRTISNSHVSGVHGTLNNVHDSSDELSVQVTNLGFVLH